MERVFTQPFWWRIESTYVVSIFTNVYNIFTTDNLLSKQELEKWECSISGNLYVTLPIDLQCLWYIHLKLFMDFDMILL